MQDTDLFQMALGLLPPWLVKCLRRAVQDDRTSTWETRKFRFRQHLIDMLEKDSLEMPDYLREDFQIVEERVRRRLKTLANRSR